MSKVSLQLINDEKLLDAFRLFPKEINEEFEMVAIEAGGILTDYARKGENHRWVHQSHDLEKDIGSRIFKRSEGVTLSFGLGFYPSDTTVFWKKENKNVSYGTILHDGEYNDKFIFGTWDKKESTVQNMYIEGANNVIERVF